jgi:hypothetical protein
LIKPLPEHSTISRRPSTKNGAIRQENLTSKPSSASALLFSGDWTVHIREAWCGNFSLKPLPSKKLISRIAEGKRGSYDYGSLQSAAEERIHLYGSSNCPNLLKL